MSNVVERLRASKERVDAKDREDGGDAGMKWVDVRAEYAALRRIKHHYLAVKNGSRKFGDHRTVLLLIDPDGELSWHDVTFDTDPSRGLSTLFLQGPPSDAWVAGFVEGAAEAFYYVEEQL